MKVFLRNIFSPILNFFEKGNEPYHLKPLNRKILVFMSILFLGLAFAVLYLMPADADKGYYLPVIVFSVIALVGLVIGLLGTDRAVAKIWGNR
jgi:hypothetical protein